MDYASNSAPVSEKELLELKNKVTEVRDTIIRAKATRQEVEKNLLSCASDLSDLGIKVKQPEHGDSDEKWDEFYTSLIRAASDKIGEMESDVSARVAAIRERIDKWGK